MEETPAQQPLDKPVYQGKAIPDPNTDFGDEAFDYNPMKQSRISTGGINEWIFNKLRPKSKVSAKTRNIPVKNPGPVTYPPTELSSKVEYLYNGSNVIPDGYEIQNGLLVQKKSLAERVRDQLRFPVLKSSQSMISGAALILFAFGAFIIYSELPTRPELVIAILMVAISANIIISNR